MVNYTWSLNKHTDSLCVYVWVRGTESLYKAMFFNEIVLTWWVCKVEIALEMVEFIKSEITAVKKLECHCSLVDVVSQQVEQRKDARKCETLGSVSVALMQVELNDGFNGGTVRTAGLFQLIHFAQFETKAPWKLACSACKLLVLIESSESATFTSSEINLTTIHLFDDLATSVRLCIVCCRDRNKEFARKISRTKKCQHQFSI